MENVFEEKEKKKKKLEDLKSKKNEEAKQKKRKRELEKEKKKKRKNVPKKIDEEKQQIESLAKAIQTNKRREKLSLNNEDIKTMKSETLPSSLPISRIASTLIWLTSSRKVLILPEHFS